MFKNYFSSVYSGDDNTSPNFTVPIHTPMPAVIFYPIKIKRIFLSFSSSPGSDKIHPEILNNLADDLAIP